MKRGTFTFDPRSWHARLYRYWKRNAEFKTRETGYRENLCHYTRVVLFWAPLHALTFPKFPKTRLPIGILTIPLILIALFPALVALTDFEFASVLYGFFLGMGIMSGTIALVDEYSTTIRRFRRRFIDPVFLRLGAFLSRNKSFFKKAAIAIAAGALTYFLVERPGDTLSFIGVIVLVLSGGVLGIGIIAGVALGVEQLKDHIKSRRGEKPSSVSQVKQTVKLATATVAAKKARICPFIEFKETSDASSS